MFAYLTQVKTVWPRLMLDAVVSSNYLVNLLPSHTSSWWPLVEDLMLSPPVKTTADNLLNTAVQHNECCYLSIDGTFRICFPLLGQSLFSEPAEVRNAQAFGDEESFYRVISIRGRTGAVLGLVPSQGERSNQLCSCLRQALPDRALLQVQHIATDSPSNRLFQDLREVCPNLSGLSLDPTHGAMHYEQATNGRKTKGSSLLRRLLAKFSASDPQITENIWGPYFDGNEVRKLTAQEANLREQILDGSMSQRRAKNVLQQASALTVWPTRIQFVEALAALAAQNQSDLQRKIEGTKMTVAKILHRLADASKCDWLFNNLRYRQFLPLSTRLLLPSGTTSNEALHAELNKHFKQIQCMHRSTLILKLNIIRFAKLLAHGSALYHPTTRQIPSNHILARRVGQPLWSKEAWKAWVQEQRTHHRTGLPLASQRSHEQAAVKGDMLKRPASKPNLKRTPFTLEREPGIQRTGVAARKNSFHPGGAFVLQALTRVTVMQLNVFWLLNVHLALNKNHKE